MKQITIGAMGRLGVNETNGSLYWDGEPLITEKRFSTQERVIAWLGLLLALVGVAATCVQAWFAAFPPAPLP